MATFSIACPGQGAQHPAMFDLALQSTAAAEWVAEYADALDIDIVALARNGDDLFSNRHGQILMCGATVATWIALSQRLPDPDVFLGYSVGEMSAYGCAGIWTPQQFAALVAQRADLMDQAAPKDAGLMAVKGMTRAMTDALCISFKLANAIIVADDHVILGGMHRDLANAEKEITARGFWCQILDVAVPAHTPMMHGAVDPFRSLVQQSFMAAPLTPVLAGINGATTTSASDIADTLAAQLNQFVDWQACMQTVVERGVTVVLEVGPGKNLAKMFNEHESRVESRSCEDFRTLDGIEKWIESRCS